MIDSATFHGYVPRTRTSAVLARTSQIVPVDKRVAQVVYSTNYPGLGHQVLNPYIQPPPTDAGRGEGIEPNQH